jgi:hypothetical protein
MASRTMSLEKQLQLAEKNLDNLLEWVSRYDNKSYVILGINMGMLGVMATLAPPPNLLDSLMIAFTLLSIILLAVSQLFVYLGNYPRLKGPSNSLFYFGAVCNLKLDQYQQEFRKRSVEEHLKDMLGQCHRNSEILNQKFTYLRWAYRTLFVAVIPWVITIYLFRTVLPVKVV